MTARASPACTSRGCTDADDAAGCPCVGAETISGRRRRDGQGCGDTEEQSPRRNREELRRSLETPAGNGALDLPVPDDSTKTAFLPQIPRTPVSPTPTAPPTRLLRLRRRACRMRGRGSRFLVPSRSCLLLRMRFRAWPVELPKLKKITEIAPFQSCGTDGSGVRMCPPNTAGDAIVVPTSIRCRRSKARSGTSSISSTAGTPRICSTRRCTLRTSTSSGMGTLTASRFRRFVSATKFGVQLAGLPYQMALAPVHKREYPLGYYRAGDPALTRRIRFRSTRKRRSRRRMCIRGFRRSRRSTSARKRPAGLAPSRSLREIEQAAAAAAEDE